MEKDNKEYIVEDVCKLEQQKKDNDLKLKWVGAIISATIGIGGFVANYNLASPDSQNVASIISYIIGILGILSSLDYFCEILSNLSDKLNYKETKKRDNKINKKLSEYGYEKKEYYMYVDNFDPLLSVDEFIELKNSNITLEELIELRDNNIPLDLFKELNELNISISDYRRLLNLGVSVEEYVDYKSQEDEFITPDSFFVKNIEKEMPNEKVIIISAIIAGVSAIMSVVGMRVNMTADEIEHAIAGGIAFLSGMPIFVGSSALTIGSILRKIGLLKTYSQVTGKKYKKKKKEE